MTLTVSPLKAPLAAYLAQPPQAAIRLFWLGQAGFVIEGGGRRLVIDPYLSDSLAQKYAGTRYPHSRMMPPPVAADEIRHVDAVLATHAHTDHLDPGTLPPLLEANPDAVLVVPRASLAVAATRSGIAPGRLHGMDAGDELALPGLRIRAVRAAHERIERDGDGNHLFLGLAMRIGGATILHTGDTIPFEGQSAELAALGADLALMPVNGRDAERAAGGVPGNLTMEEAILLCRSAGIDALIAHHFGMFDFNTVPRAAVEAAARDSALAHAVAAETGLVYGLAQD